MRGRKKSQTKREIFIKTKKKTKKKRKPSVGIFRSFCHLKKNNNFAPKNELSPFGGMKGGEREGVCCCV